jgi:hypothetical protein
VNTFGILLVALLAVVVALWALWPWRRRRFWVTAGRFEVLMAGPGCRPEDPATDEEADEDEPEPKK